MIKITDKELADFFKNYPLYSKIIFFEIPSDNTVIKMYEYFESKAYEFYCPFEKGYHTFKIQKKYEYVVELSSDIERYFTLEKDSKLSYTFSLTSKCQSCDFRMDFLINLFTEDPFIAGEKLPSIFLRKIGQFPPFERNPEKEVLDYLNEEDCENYKKALSNLAVSYGIGAFAYFRRIIENEIKKIVKDLAQLDFEGSDKIKSALEVYESNHQMSNLIDSIGPYVPSSLIDNGNNLIKLLHQQLSGGLHEYSEEVCLEKAKQIDTVLRYVIKKVNSEKSELKEIRKAIDLLKK
jgi:hypothetical protein